MQESVGYGYRKDWFGSGEEDVCPSLMKKGGHELNPTGWLGRKVIPGRAKASGDRQAGIGV